MKRTFCLWICLWLGSVCSNSAEEGTRLDRQNLLLYRKTSGEVVQGKALADWQKRREEILRGAMSVMGPLPGDEKRTPLDVMVEEEVDCGTYFRRLISYQSEPNSRVPAYLLIPKAALEKGKKHPAVLALHPTSPEFGHKMVVGLGNRQNRSYAAELAERGFVVLAPSYPQLANYWPDLKSLGYESGTMKAIWDNIRGMDLLDSMANVQKGHYGVIGHSLGGHNAIYTAVFDPRIKVIVSSCGFDSYLDYMNGNIKGWTHTRYMPRLLDYPLEQIPFDFHELVGALAPRPFYINAPKGDTNFKWESVERIVAAAQPIYKLHGKAGNIHVVHPDCGHDFPPDIRYESYDFIAQALKKKTTQTRSQR
ncbi:MAG: alpha/beta hydrolase family protein [Limisphaerales bacterium]